MYKTVNGHGPEIRKESFHNISSIHWHATKSAVKGDLFVPRKTTGIAQRTDSVAGPRLWNNIPSTGCPNKNAAFLTKHEAIAFCSIAKILFDSERVCINLDFDTLASPIRRIFFKIRKFKNINLFSKS